MKTTIIKSVQQLSQLKDQWNDLYNKAECYNVFLSFEWIYNWCCTFVQMEKLYICCIEYKHELISIAPLCKQKGKISFLVDPLYADFSGILVHPDFKQVTYFIFSKLLQNDCTSFLLYPLSNESDNITTYCDNISLNNFHFRKFIWTSSPYVEISKDFNTYFKTRSKKLKQELRTTINNLQKNGKLEFVHYSDSNSEACQEIFFSLVKFHKRRQEQKAGKSIFSDQKNINFFHSLVQKRERPWQVGMSAIKLDGRIVSASYSLVSANYYFYWMPSFDQTIKSVSLGKLHVKYILEFCFNNNFKRFDFMGGRENYKFQWATGNYDLYCIEGYRSKIIFNWKKIQLKIKKILIMEKNKYMILDKFWRKLSKLSFVIS